MKLELQARVVLLALAALGTSAVQAQMKVGVIASATGPTAAVGIAQKNSAALLPRKIGAIDIEYTVLDDASDSTQTVALVKKLLVEHKNMTPQDHAGFDRRGRELMMLSNGVWQLMPE